MQYNILLQNLANQYVNQFLIFIRNYNLSITVEEAHYLLDYTISTLYGVECQWYTDSIRMYGSVSVGVMRSCIGVDESLYYEDRVSLVQLCCSYFTQVVGVAL